MAVPRLGLRHHPVCEHRPFDLCEIPAETSWEKLARRSLLKKGATNWQLPPMYNAIDPRHLSTAERLDEIADILAAGLMRLRARKSSLSIGFQI